MARHGMDEAGSFELFLSILELAMVGGKIEKHLGIFLVDDMGLRSRIL